MELEELRNEINDIDDELAALFQKRMDVALRIARYKRDNNLPVLDRTRERALLNRMAKKSGEDLELYTRLLFTSLMDVSRAYQHRYLDGEAELSRRVADTARAFREQNFPKKAVVACQGVEGAYSGLAAERLFSRPEILYFNTWEDVFRAVDSGLCKYGVLPIENSTAGSVNKVYDLMHTHKFSIARSVRLRVGHTLLANRGTRLSDIREIFSHEQAIRQCSAFLEALGDVKITVCENTAKAAERVAQSGRTDAAAISSKQCAALYGLQALSYEIQNSDNNYTRFICISKECEIYPGAQRTSLMMTLPHKPGALYSVLSRFYAMDINLLKLESRPLLGSDFEFMFYFDIESPVDESLCRLLGELSHSAEQFTYLGSYSELL